tara:strand:- start:2122 stop:5640 length:3519 start_codon:yes stop_codon:yes gene_type:complete
LKNSIISYVNTNSDNTLQIESSRFNLKGEFVISDLLLSNKNTDTILILETLKTKYFPLISDNSYESSLFIEGLDVYINNNNNKVESSFYPDGIKEILDDLFFDSLTVSNSNLFIVNDSINHSIEINNMKINQINKNDDGVNFNLSMFNGNINKYSIDRFDSYFELNGTNVILKNTYLSNENQYLEGNLDFYLDDDFKINRFNKSDIRYNLSPEMLNIISSDLKLSDFISGDINFSGSKDKLLIDEASLTTNLFNLNAKIDIENVFSSNFNAKIDLNDINFNEENINSKYDIDDRVYYPSMNGDLILVDNKIIYKLNQNEKSKTEVDIEGTANFENDLIYNLALKINVDSEDKILDFLNLNSLTLNSNISGTSDQLSSIESSVVLFKNNKEFEIDLNSYFNNNDIIAQIELVSENININSTILGDNSNKKYKVNSDIDIKNFVNPQIQDLRSNAVIDIDFSEPENIKSLVSLQNIFIKNSLDEFSLESLSNINELLDYNFIDINRDNDFAITYSNNIFSIESYLGDGLSLSGYYKNNDDLDLEIQTSNLYVSNFFMINKNPIKGKITSSINLDRDSENRFFSLTSNISDINIKNYNLGEINLRVFGNTDYNSYAINLDLSEKDKKFISGEGTIIAISEKPNIDIDLLINEFDISFIEKIGLNTMSQISSKVSGELNLWGGLDKIQHNGKLYLNDSSFFIPFLNIEYFLSENSELTLYNQNFELNNIFLTTNDLESMTYLDGRIFHNDYKNWNLDLNFKSDRLFILNKEFSDRESFYGKAFIGGDILIKGPTDKVSINIDGKTKEGTSIVIPQSKNYTVEDFPFIEFSDLNSYLNKLSETNSASVKSEKTLDLIMNLEIDDSAQVEITIDQETGSYLSGKGNGDLFMEIDSGGKFNMYGDFITNEGIYNFRNLALIDKRFKLRKGGSITWDGEPLGAQMNIQATYEVPGGANPALLLDNPNFNKKIPTDVEIKLTGDLTKPDSPDFEIFFPNTSSTVTSEINYKLNDPEVRQLQAISLLTQGIFINEVSVSIEGVTNNIYEKVSEVFSDILGGSQGPLEVGLNYLQGDKSEILDIKTEDRFGVTLSTKISDKILFNGKIGVPIGGIEETLIIGDVQIDFILNEDGSLRAKVFNRENEFRYIGDELGYTQGIGVSYQVDFQTFRDLLSKIISNNN